jgi:hypothetical protein
LVQHCHAGQYAQSITSHRPGPAQRRRCSISTRRCSLE